MTSFIGIWVFRIGIGYVLGIICNLGVLGVWIGMYINWFVRGIMYSFRLRGEKWLKRKL
jgi:Na+-driven multidrug efflux pump